MSVNGHNFATTRFIVNVRTLNHPTTRVEALTVLNCSIKLLVSYEPTKLKSVMV